MEEEESQVKPRGEALIGCRISLFWGGDDAWYEGVVKKYVAAGERHTVRYDDGDKKTHKMDNERWRCLSTPPPAAAATPAAPTAGCGVRAGAAGTASSSGAATGAATAAAAVSAVGSASASKAPSPLPAKRVAPEPLGAAQPQKAKREQSVAQSDLAGGGREREARSDACEDVEMLPASRKRPRFEESNDTMTRGDVGGSPLLTPGSAAHLPLYATPFPARSPTAPTNPPIHCWSTHRCAVCMHLRRDQGREAEQKGFENGLRGLDG